MKKVIDVLHVVFILLVPGYWIAAILIYVHHKFKHQPVKLKQEKVKIQKKVQEKMHIKGG